MGSAHHRAVVEDGLMTSSATGQSSPARSVARHTGQDRRFVGSGRRCTLTTTAIIGRRAEASTTTASALYSVGIRSGIFAESTRTSSWGGTSTPSRPVSN